MDEHTAVPAAVGSIFEAAAREALAWLARELPWAMWSVTRVENGHQTHLYVHDAGYGIQVGDHEPWLDTFCIKMVAGEGPRMAHDTDGIPAYRSQAIASRVKIGAYAGVPIREEDGTLFGVLCGANPSAVDANVSAHLPTLEMISSMLGLALVGDRARDRLAQIETNELIGAVNDPLTGTMARPAWDAMLDAEEERQRTFADPAVIVVIDVDGMKAVNDRHGPAGGDAVLVAVASALRSAVRGDDPVARLSGDEFGILLRGCETEQAPARVLEMHLALASAGVSASIGWAGHTLHGGFRGARHDADEAMRAAKQARSQTG